MPFKHAFLKVKLGALAGVYAHVPELSSIANVNTVLHEALWESVAETEDLLHGSLRQLAGIEGSRGTADYDPVVTCFHGKAANTATGPFGNPKREALAEIGKGGRGGRRALCSSAARRSGEMSLLVGGLSPVPFDPIPDFTAMDRDVGGGGNPQAYACFAHVHDVRW